MILSASSDYHTGHVTLIDYESRLPYKAYNDSFRLYYHSCCQRESQVFSGHKFNLNLVVRKLYKSVASRFGTLVVTKRLRVTVL